MRALDVVDLGSGVPHDEGVRAMADFARAVDERPTLLLVEHRPTITLTRSAGEKSLRLPIDAIRARGIDVTTAERGGDATFHGDGQLVGYPIVRLPRVRLPLGDAASGNTELGAESIDLTGYARALEGALVDACRALGVESAHTEPGLTGVWVGPAGPSSTKLVAIGIGVSPRGITRHGFALNVDIDVARYTACIVPCGLTGRETTTLRALLGDATPSKDVVKYTVADHVARALGFDAAAPISRRAPSPVTHDDAPRLSDAEPHTETREDRRHAVIGAPHG